MGTLFTTSPKNLSKTKFKNVKMGGGNKGGGNVGKSGREGCYSPPIDLYRRQIAKQDTKKERKHLKEVKHQAESKSWTPKATKDVVIVLLSFLAVLMVIYAILYYSMNKKLPLKSDS